MSKRASYREGVDWIARNDNAGNGDDVDAIASYISTALLADLFGKNDYEAACDIMKARERVKSEDEAAERKRIADHVDGYDRDDLGESPDY